MLLTSSHKRLLALGVVCAALSGCPPQEYPWCEKDGECQGGEVCVFGECLRCALDSHCSARQSCKAYKCVDAVTTCKQHSDCSFGQFCMGGVCSSHCSADGDCPANRSCVNSACQLKAGACDNPFDCPQSQQCVDGACKEGGTGTANFDSVKDPDFSHAEGMSGVDLATPADVCGQATRIYFGFNESGLTDEARATLNKVAQCMRTQKPELKLTIEGHCDERGSTEFNLALGERRAMSVRSFLGDLGVQKARVTTVSLGEERPLDEGHDEAAWAKNRRAELVDSHKP